MSIPFLTTSTPALLGWIPFFLCLVGSLISSWLYIMWHRSIRDGEGCKVTILITTLSLTITLLTAGLVPVDVFLVSSMKNTDGTYEDWASDPEFRSEFLEHVMIAYYVLFSLVLLFTFLILPLNFFYHAGAPLAEDHDDDEDAIETPGKKCCRALKFTSASVFLLVFLILLGIFVPFEGTEPKGFLLEQKIEYDWHQFQNNKGFDLIVFMLNSVSLVGMALLIFYTGYGMSSWPFSLIGGTSTVHNEVRSLEIQISTIQNRLQSLQEQGGTRNEIEQQEITRLEREERMLDRQRHELEQVAKSCTNRCILFLRPFQFMFGIFFALLGLLIFVSILLTNIDKAIHCKDAKSGYVLRNGTLPNPTDMLLVYAQVAFPLDYIIYTGIVLFFVISSVFGVKQIGIKFVWLSLYKIKAHGTKPQALALMSLTLTLILLSLNIVLFTIAPDYTMYGSQHFIQNNTETNTTTILHCTDTHSSELDCNKTRISVILLALHTKAWIFGALQYWMSWMFLLVIFGGSFIAMFNCIKSRRTRRNLSLDGDQEELINSDDETT